MDRIILRELEKSDIPRINEWRNDAEVISQLGANFIYISEDVDYRWFENYQANRERSIRLAILDKATESHIGNIYLTEIQQINRSAEFSIFIGQSKFRSKGYGFEAIKLILSHGFKDLNLNRIHLTVLTDNLRAKRVYEKAGFQFEGKLRQAVFKNGEYKDLDFMAILKTEFLT